MVGLRLVKRTINLDDPGSYHFYFWDDLGSPGTNGPFGVGAKGVNNMVWTTFRYYLP